MRRVVVTGMGIVSSIGNNAQEVLASLREAQLGHRLRAENMPSSASAARCTAPRRSTRERWSTAAPRASWRSGAAWNHIAMEQAIADAGPRGRTTSRTSAPA